MIIGHGTIASVLTDREDRLYFASGVPNSAEKRESEYRREVELLEAQDRRLHLVYFSSLSVFYQDTRYTQHKRRMEGLIKSRFRRWCIMRLGNPVWGDNPVHLVPFLRRQVESCAKLELRDVWRYPLELDEFLHWVSLIPDWSCEMNVTGRMMKPEEILQKYVLPKLY